MSFSLRQYDVLERFMQLDAEGSVLLKSYDLTISNEPRYVERTESEVELIGESEQPEESASDGCGCGTTGSHGSSAFLLSMMALPCLGYETVCSLDTFCGSVLMLGPHHVPMRLGDGTDSRPRKVR